MKKESKYMRLFEEIRAGIISGEYVGGSRIPGENELSKRYGMSRQTVRQSLSILEQKGFIERRQGSGTYVTENQNSKKKTWNVGVIATYISEYIFPSILRGIEDELSQAGFSTVVSATKNRFDNERRILEDYLEKPIDGLIVEATKSALPNPNIGLYEALMAKGIPVVFFNGRYQVLEDCTCVMMNDRQGGYRAASYLMDTGHKKIGGIFKSDDMQGLERYSGYLNGVLERGMTIKDDWTIWYNSENRDHIFEEDNWILEAIKPCSAVICYNDEIALRLIQILLGNGLRVPGDKAVISFDNSLFSSVSQVPVTSLDHPKEILGSSAARKLVGMISGKTEKSLIMEWGFSIKRSG